MYRVLSTIYNAAGLFSAKLIIGVKLYRWVMGIGFLLLALWPLVLWSDLMGDHDDQDATPDTVPTVALPDGDPPG